VCGDKVRNMHYAYQNCSNLTGSPVCGNNVTNMRNAYYNCYNLTGSPVCGDKVLSMDMTYYNCRNLTGSPVCGLNVADMNNAYSYCYNLTGSPVCGNRVFDMSYTYYCCYNLSGNMYIYSDIILNVKKCFYGKNNSRRYNIYAHPNTETWNTLLVNNSYSLVGYNITWTNDITTNGCYYNAIYNIYIYPVANVRKAYLDIEFSNVSPNIYNINYINNETIQPKTSWIYNGVSENIDNGYMIAVPLNLTALENVTIDNAEDIFI
jgi:hypothetical protein